MKTIAAERDKKFACHGQESNLRHPDHNRMYYHYTTAARIYDGDEPVDRTGLECVNTAAERLLGRGWTTNQDRLAQRGIFIDSPDKNREQGRLQGKQSECPFPSCEVDE